MAFGPLLFIAVFIYFDLSVLRKQNAQIFRDVFCLPRGIHRAIGYAYGILLVLLSIIMVKAGYGEYLLVFWVGLFFPIYLLRRNRFKKLLSSSGASGAEDKDAFFAAEVFDLLWKWFLGLLGASIFIKIVTSLFSQTDSKLGEMIFLSVFGALLMVHLIGRLVARHPDLKILKVLGLSRNHQSILRIVILPLLIGLACAYVSSLVIISRSYQPMTPFNEALAQEFSPLIFLAFIVVATLVAPFFEEIIFRGFFFYVIQRFKGKVFAVIFIGAIFGVLHYDQYWGDVHAIAMITLLGFILTALRAWTGSSIASIVAHYAFNGAMTILPVVMILAANPVYLEYQLKYRQMDPLAREELLLKSIKTYPGHAASYNDLAWSYAEENYNLDEALILADKALSLSPGNYSFLDTKAEVLYKMGRTDEAVAIAEKLVEEYPLDDYAKTQLNKFRNSNMQIPNSK